MIQRALLTLVGVLALQGVGRAADSEVPSTWTGVSKVIAVGDLHGSYEKAIRLLQAAGLIDEDLHWSGGEQHLVVAGDFVDRGPSDRALMDFFRRLQPEAEAAGGRAHLLLGNHEAMNLMRDLRYVNPESYQAWAEDEKKADRRAAWRIFSKAMAASGKGQVSIEEFDEQYPPGYFARQQSFDRDGEYGSWLLELPATVKINDVVFLHGGLTVETAALGIDEINRSLQEELREHLKAREYLEARGIVTPLMTFGEILWMAKDAMTRSEDLPRDIGRAVERIYASFKGLLLGENGPLWYRGGSFEDERIESEMIARVLELMDAKAVVVAHSPTPNQRITSRFHGQLYRVDHDINGSDNLQALVVESEEILVLDASTGETTQAESELPVGKFDPRSAERMSDSELREFLAEAAIVDWRYLGRGSTRPRLLELEMAGRRQRGIFKTVEETDSPSPEGSTDRFEHEVAAYRLDRELGLNMVPTTVIREIDGQRGSLQSWVEGAVDREAAEAYDLDLFENETVSEQLEQSEIFDALIGNFDRGPDDQLCLVNREKVLLIDHSKAFSTSPEIPGRAGRSYSVDPRLLAELQGLEQDHLEQLLGDLLSERQIEAIMQRRDKILARLSASAPATLSQS